MTEPISRDERLFKVALDTRNFEISLFWQRSSYFLVLNSALAVGFFKEQIHTTVLALLGTAASLLWFFVSIGSKYWQDRWEREVVVREQKLHLDEPMFSADHHRADQFVRDSQRWSDHGWARRLVDRMVLRKPSVSFAMIMLSLAFSVCWGVLLALNVTWMKPGLMKAGEFALNAMSSLALESVRIALDLLASASGLIAVVYWHRSSRIQIDPGWRTQPGEEMATQAGWLGGTMQAFSESANLNARAARWTAIAVALAVLSTCIRIAVAL